MIYEKEISITLRLTYYLNHSSRVLWSPSPTAKMSRVRSLESLPDGHNWFYYLFVEIPRVIYHCLFLISFGKSRIKTSHHLRSAVHGYRLQSQASRFHRVYGKKGCDKNRDRLQDHFKEM
jgi:hypothetical protein